MQLSDPRVIEQWGGGGAAIWWAALNQVDGIGAATMLRLARAFGSPEAAVNAPADQLTALGRLTPEQAAAVVRQARQIGLLRTMIASWKRAGIGLLAIGDPSYPAQLLDLKTPPPLLYLRGSPVPEDAQAVAVVGTREPTREGEVVAAKLSREFAARGLTNVSGLARGIDTAGHRGSLSASSGRTIAVLGSGVMRIYPPENARLADEIAKRGCLMSEVPPETEVSRRFLLARDRIQAGLSLAVIVVQAHRECGSIVTATHALACRRLLLAVPWETGPFAEGWEKLRSLGAIPIGDAAELDAIAHRILTPKSPTSQRPLL
jgi:DNA processing protein